jgi:hypothetical protein
VASTTLVDNLNADTVDGVEEAAFAYVDGTRDFTGSVTVATGDLYLDDASNPTLFIREGGDTVNYGSIVVPDAAQLQIMHRRNDGDSFLAFDPIPANASDKAEVRYFRTTNTSGLVQLVFYVGDGTSTEQHTFRADNGDINICQQAGQTTIGGIGGSEKLTVVGDASIGDGGTTDYVLVDTNKLLSFQADADIAAAVDQKILFRSYIDVKARNGVYSLHGGLDLLDTAHDLGAGDLVVSCGTGKIMLSVNAGPDLDGEITITGTTVDRDTGVETADDTDTLTIDSATTDNTTTDAEGNSIPAFVGAYLTSKWFKGSITISSSDTDVTDMDTYQVSFDQMDDSPGITLDTFDITATATNSSAWLYAYLHTLHVTGDKCDIDDESSIALPAADVGSGLTYRLRRSGIDESFSGETDGFWVDFFPGPLASNYWENINIQVWARIKRVVYGEASRTMEMSGLIVDPDGAPVSGVLATLSGDDDDTDTTGADGAYSFAGLSKGSYTVTPTLASYDMAPASRAVEVLSWDVEVADFISSLTLPVTVNWESDTIGNSPTETPMFSGDTSTVRAIELINSAPAGLTKMVETITAAGNRAHNWRTPEKFDISNGIRIEVVASWDQTSSDEDMYTGLAGDFVVDASDDGRPDYHVMSLFREADNDVYQRYSISDVSDWVTENQTDVTQNILPAEWGHFQVEYKPDDDDWISQYRVIHNESAGGWKTLTLASNWDKPDYAYVIFGGLNNDASFVRIANVWIGGLGDAWPYVGTP